MLIGLILAAEVAFWVVLAAGLLVRYGLRRPRLGAVLLALVPLVDLVLLVATALDLRAGGVATRAHGLAAVYIGFSVAFGHSLIRWADQRVAHRFAGGPPPERPPRGGWARATYEWREFGKALLGALVTAALLLTAVLVVDDADRTQALLGWLPTLGVVLAVWFIGWPLWTTLAALGTRTRPDPCPTC